jgi:dipeptidyl aminopeptidase/acylaminoacyl peptidase
MTRSRGSVSKRLLWAVPALLLLLSPLRLTGQQTAPAGQASSWAEDVLKQEGYATPPKELADAVLIPRYQNVSLTNLSPDKKWFLDEIGDGPVLMKTFSKPFHELGGLFVDYKANRSRTLTIRNNVGIQIVSTADGSKRAIQLPAGARVSNAAWSPDSTAIAFFIHADDATYLWAADVATGKARQLTKSPLLATLVSTFEFTTDGKQIATVLIPEPRAPMPKAPMSPTGPTVKIADSDRNRLRTFPSLMSTTYEKELLEWHTIGQLAFVDVQKGTVRKIGQPSMIRSLDVSPDLRFARVTRMVKPFSYDVPVNNFGSIEEVWDVTDGKTIAQVIDRPINLGVQDDSQPPDPDPAGGGRGGQNQTGKREVAWRADGQGLTFLEQEPPPPGESNAGARGARARGGRGAGQGAANQEGGRSGRAQRKDRLYQWSAPFDDASKKVILESENRMTGVRYSPDMKMVFFSERSGQNTTEYAVNLAEAAQRYTLARYAADDVYANPGTLVGVRGTGVPTGRGGGGGGGRGGAGTANAGPVQLSADGASVFFTGSVYDKNPADVGPKTFIDKVAIKTGDRQRIYESNNNGVYERVSSILDVNASRFVVSRESPTDIDQQFVVDQGRRTQLTNNQDYTPDLTRALVDRFVVERPDGFKFRATVTLPQGYQKGTRLPAIFWFYPREYEDQDAYDRPDRTFNKNAFPTFGTRSMEFLIRLGYAVVEPDSPIVGPAGEMNNNYVHDLRNNLAAVIDELDRRAIVDRTRLAIGGHSYGAFSAVNAMVHTPFFKAGIAGDGAYNRTLTPIGFQSERRDLWQAPNVYLSMSPFLYANNLTGALLMYHNLADQNVGTDPINSIRLYHALNGLGKTTALYLYPYEDHGPVAKETLLDLWARWSAWLDKYVKNPKPEAKKTSTTEQAAR